MKHWLDTYGTWISLGCLWALIAWNVVTALRNRQTRVIMDGLRKDIEDYHRDKAPMLVDALEAMARATCPFCAVASGHVHDCRFEDQPFTAELEEDGYHIAHTPHRGNVKCPCLAAKARADARLTLNEQAEKLEKLVEGK